MLEIAGTKSTGKLEAGRQVEWTWEMYNYTAPVLVKSIEPNKTLDPSLTTYDSSTVRLVIKRKNRQVTSKVKPTYTAFIPL